MLNEVLDDDFINEQSSSNLSKLDVAKINRLKTDINHEMSNAKKGRNAILFMMGYLLVSVLFEYSSSDEIMKSTVLLGAGIIMFFACASFVLYCFNNMGGLIMALVVFILIWMLSIIGDVSMVYRGILIRGGIIFYLIIGISALAKCKSIKTQLRTLGVPGNELEMIASLTPLPKTAIPMNDD